MFRIEKRNYCFLAVLLHDRITFQSLSFAGIILCMVEKLFSLMFYQNLEMYSKVGYGIQQTSSNSTQLKMKTKAVSYCNFKKINE